jgi:hypothetical protein
MPPNADVEDIIRELTQISDGEVKIASDMWWGVKVEGVLSSDEYATWVACDRLAYGLMATYRHWAGKYAEVSKRSWRPSWER